MRHSGALPDRLPAAPRRAGRLLGLALPGLALLGLAACDAPPEARFPISEKGAALPTPELGETARFGRVAGTSGTEGGALEADRAALAARAEALRARAADLSGPVLDPATRTRLLDARESGAAAPPP
ncbi:hypothetical protein [Amaricoccus solimangrovi]|uniref:Uncharacterized protein n=1 Tax=Amaricoccus solimangrovi TaxID=2589815 RepID=A0A501WYJ6_9RHOB|nr:hypothetical protein [Amaricoccus solimangrovi]TPE52101.1 hypothetical protein FJM51_06645 [Amaricoccus solimangrovi]